MSNEITVDQSMINAGALLLNDLWDEVCTMDEPPTCEIASTVDLVLGYDKAKTYKYILMTQLLGKALDERVNILAMHGASELPGSWSARTLCEQVITSHKNPGFEEVVLSGILGRTKQPYNNAPGQKHELSKANATRMSDVPVRDALIDGLSTIGTSEEARDALRYFLYICRRQIEQLDSEEPEAWAGPETTSVASFQRFLTDLSTVGREGEGLSLATAVLLDTALGPLGIDVALYQINTHRRGQGDIDLFLGSDRVASIEVKDKPFSLNVVDSYVQDAVDTGTRKAMFVYGAGAGEGSSALTSDRRREWLSHDVLVSCLSLSALMDATLLPITSINPGTVRSSITRLMHDANMGPQTVSPVRQLLRGFLQEVGQQA